MPRKSKTSTPQSHSAPSSSSRASSSGQVISSEPCNIPVSSSSQYSPRQNPVDIPNTVADPILITVWNDKGGVGKTTATYSLGYILQDLGLRVLMVDTDHQKNLTHLVWPHKFLPPKSQHTLSLMSKLPDNDKSKAENNRIYIKEATREYVLRNSKGVICEGILPAIRGLERLSFNLTNISLKREILIYISRMHEDIVAKVEFEEFLEKARREADAEEKYSTISGLFKDVVTTRELKQEGTLSTKASKVELSRVAIDKTGPYDCSDYENLFFLPAGTGSDGSGGSYIVELDEKVRESIKEGADTHIGYSSYISNIFRAIGRHNKLHVILFDMNPYPNYFNQALMIGSDYLLVPCFSDFFSVEAIKMIGEILPSWYQVFHKRDEDITAKGLAVIESVPKFIGIFPQRIKVHNQIYQQSQAYYIDRLSIEVELLKKKLEKFPKKQRPDPALMMLGLEKYVSMLQAENDNSDKSANEYRCRGVLDFASPGLDVQETGRPLCDFRFKHEHSTPDGKHTSPIKPSVIWNNYRAFLEVVNMAIRNFSPHDFAKLPKEFRECITLTRNLQFRVANDQEEPLYAPSPLPLLPEPEAAVSVPETLSLHEEIYQTVGEERDRFIVCPETNSARCLISKAIIDSLGRVKNLDPANTPNPIILLPINLGEPHENPQNENTDLDYWGILAIHFKPQHRLSEKANFPFSIQLLVLFDPLGFSQILRKKDDPDKDSKSKNPRVIAIKDISKVGGDSIEHVTAVLERVHKSVDILDNEKLPKTNSHSTKSSKSTNSKGKGERTKRPKGAIRELKSKDANLAGPIKELSKIPLCYTTCGPFRDTTKSTRRWVVNWVHSIVHDSNLLPSQPYGENADKPNTCQEANQTSRHNTATLNRTRNAEERTLPAASMGRPPATQPPALVTARKIATNTSLRSQSSGTSLEATKSTSSSLFQKGTSATILPATLSQSSQQKANVPASAPHLRPLPMPALFSNSNTLPHSAGPSPVSNSSTKPKPSNAKGSSMASSFSQGSPAFLAPTRKRRVSDSDDIQPTKRAKSSQ